MSDRKTRGKPNKVDQLPEEIKTELIELLRDPSITQTQVLKHVNAMIEDAGLPDEEKLSKSGINRYATRMTTVGGRIQEAREVSKMWVDQLGNKPTGEVSKVLIEMVRTLAFDSVLKMSESDEVVEPKFIKELAIGVEKLEKAASESHKREREIQTAYAEQKAQEVEELRGEDGMSEALENKIKNILLGK